MTPPLVVCALTLPVSAVERDLSVGIGDVDHGIFRRADVVPHLEGGADHDAAHPLGLERDAVRLDVFLDDDPRQQLAGRRVGGAAGDPLGPTSTVDPSVPSISILPLVLTIRISPPALEGIAAGPFVGRPAGEVAAATCRSRPGATASGRSRTPIRRETQLSIEDLLGMHTRGRGAQFNWTEISFDTPGSSIVTP